MFDPRDKDKEKGFRDALILETVASECAKAANETVIFICNDHLLRTATEERLKTSKRFLAFESLADFGAYLTLTQQQLTDAFVKAIQGHARRKFYTKGDPNCVYAKFGVSAAVLEKFEEALAFEGQIATSVSNGMDAPTRTGINVPKWQRYFTT